MSKKSKSTSGPSKWAKGYITPAIGEINSVYDQNKGAVGEIASGVQGLVPGLIDKYNAGDPNVNAAKGYNSDVLGGKYLDQGNPYLENIIGKTRNDTLGAVGGAFGSRGAFGGTKYAEAAGRGVADAENTLRYNDYGAERGRMDSAVGQATQLAGSDNQDLLSLLQAAQAGTELPFAASNNLARQLAGLLGNSTTTTQTQGAGSTIGGLIGSGLAGWASGGFKGA